MVKFKQREDIGREYFECSDFNDMVDIIYNCIKTGHKFMCSDVLGLNQANKPEIKQSLVNLDMIGKFFECIAKDKFKIRFESVSVDKISYDNDNIPYYTINVSDIENTCYSNNDNRRYIRTVLLYEIFKRWIVLFGDNSNIYSLIKFSTASKQYVEHKNIRLSNHKIRVIDMTTNKFLLK